MGTPENLTKQNNFSSMLKYLVVIAVAATYFLAILVIFSGLLNFGLNLNLILPLILVFGVISLVGVLTLSSGVLQHFGLSCPDEALGLPSGSVRALIALSLIVIFAIMSVFMGSQLNPTPLTYGNGSYVMDVNGTVQFTQISQGQRDFSLQTLTTISTLVVAVAGFYFGSKAVETARGDKKTSLTITTDPKDFADVKSDGNLKITVTTDPDNEAVEWVVEGDDHDSVIYEGKGVFTYKPKAKPPRKKDQVVITFQAAKDISQQNKIKIKIEEATEKSQEKSEKPSPKTTKQTDKENTE